MSFDVVIVGAGLTGVSLARALSLAELDISVGLVDAVAPRRIDHPGYDDRAIALAEGSMRILSSLGAGEALRRETSPIASVHVSDKGHFGFTRLTAAEVGLPALGYVTDARTLGNVLVDLLDSTDAVARFMPAAAVGVEINASHIRLRLHDLERDTQQDLTTRLLVAADGGHSRIRELLGIDAVQSDYGQSAITANVVSARAHRQVAYERFTGTGPLALLPLADGRSAMIWTLATEHATRLAALDDDRFLHALGECFGDRLGPFTRIGQRAVYPLTLIRAREQIRERLVVLGNAARNLHPVAGQGLNLGLRDVAALAETLADAFRAGIDLGDRRHLQAYEAWRAGEQREVTWFTDSVVRLFSVDLAPVNAARNLGLLLLDSLPPIKRRFIQRATGLAGRQSRLARGVAL